MFSDSLWYLSAVAYTENGETRYLTADELEALEDTDAALDDDYYALLFLLRTVLHFAEDGQLAVLIPLEDDELEDPSYRERMTITEDGCMLIGTFPWEERDGTLYVSGRFPAQLLSSPAPVAYAETEPLPLSADGSFILGDRLVFRRFEDEDC